MKTVFDRTLPRDVQSPVRASNLSKNWFSLSFFNQITAREQLLASLGHK